MLQNSLYISTQGNPSHPALVFLHAFPLTSDMWQDQMNFFSENFYCVAPDLPGFGKSPLANHGVTFEYYVDSVLEVLKEQKINKSIWCGLSMGGYLALRMYQRAPELCQGLVLCDTKAGADTNEAKLKRWDIIQLLKKNREEFLGAQWKALVSEESQRNPHLQQRFSNIIAQVTDEGIATGLVALATRNESGPYLSQISVPTLIVVGEEDKVTPPAEAEILHQGIRESQKILIPKVGHLSNLEDPQKFNDCLSEYLLRFS